MKSIMIVRTIKNIKKYFKTLKKIQQKYQQKKKILYKILEGVLTAKIAV